MDFFNLISKWFQCWPIDKEKTGGEKMKNVTNFMISFCICIIALCFLFASMADANEIIVNSYYGKYDANKKKVGFPSERLEGPVTEKWITPKPKRNYHIGVLFPHLKDSYWIAANYGIITHAKELGVNITLHTAGAYGRFGDQREQLMSLATKTKADGIILASVDYTKMDRFVAEVTDLGVPVIGLINDITAPAIKAKALVSFFKMGYKAGEYVVKDSGGKDIKVAFFPGPQKSGWAPETYEGFMSAVSEHKKPGQKVTVLEPSYGDTRPDVQLMRLEHCLDKPENSNINYIVGCAVAAVEAVKYLSKNREKHPKARIVSTYITITVYEQINKGKIVASPSDQTTVQCIMALDMMVRLLNGEQAGKDFPFRSGPVIPVITKDNVGEYSYEYLFGEKGFVPVVHTMKK